MIIFGNLIYAEVFIIPKVTNAWKSTYLKHSFIADDDDEEGKDWTEFNEGNTHDNETNLAETQEEYDEDGLYIA